jgi:predicted thioredoxin/glutaredoxin
VKHFLAVSFVIILCAALCGWIAYLIYDKGFEQGRIVGLRERDENYEKSIKHRENDYWREHDKVQQLERELKFWKTVMPLAKD